MIYMLHISDLHLLKDPNANNMIESLLYHVKNQIIINKIPKNKRLLIITGDFHNYKENDYNKTLLFLNRLIKHMELNKTEDVFMVPGNHDVDNSSKNNIGRENSIYRLKDNPKELKNQLHILERKEFYKSYLEFQKKLGVYSEEEIRDLIPIKTHVRSWRQRINFLHLNTTLISSGNKSKQLCDVITATSKETLDELNKAEITSFCLGHNSYFDLHENQQKNLIGPLKNGHISAYLCGDRHIAFENINQTTINLEIGPNPITIPNLVCSRSSTDENDEYSDFGIFWHIVEESDIKNYKAPQRKVKLEYYYWESDNPGLMTKREPFEYIIRNHIIEKDNKLVKDYQKEYILETKENLHEEDFVHINKINEEKEQFFNNSLSDYINDKGDLGQYDVTESNDDGYDFFHKVITILITVFIVISFAVLFFRSYYNVSNETVEPITVQIKPKTPSNKNVVEISVFGEKLHPAYHLVMINFMNEEGKFDKYYIFNRNENFESIEYKSSGWFLYGVYEDTTQFRVEIMNKSNYEILYITEVYTIDVFQDSNELYHQIYKGKKGDEIYDEKSNMYLKVTDIYSTYATVIIETSSKILYRYMVAGESESFSYINNNYQVIFVELNYEEGTFCVEVREIKQ